MVPGKRVRKSARFVIVEFGSESEWDGEDDGTGWMASPDASAPQTCFAATSDACILAGFAARTMGDLMKMNWSRTYLQACKNCV